MFWNGKRVLVTGHTGFKGAWLSLSLQALNAEVTGFSLAPPTSPSLFEQANVAQGMRSILGDVNDAAAVGAAFAESSPEVVIHMAAQPLVRESYVDPAGTYLTNVVGTANVLNAVRNCQSVRSVVVITTDKCYENREWAWPYREDDRLGGYDPYSSSKACTELVVSSFRNSFFHESRYAKHGVALASARAGNVLGGGDWAKDRLIPDIIRAFAAGRTLVIRNPIAVRPWQHVLEPLRGYLMLAENLYTRGIEFSGAWNFGPQYDDARPVEWIVRKMASKWEGAEWVIDNSEQPHEAQMLKLDWSKAAQMLQWRPALSLETALEFACEWYRGVALGGSARELCDRQIALYSDLTPGQVIPDTPVPAMAELVTI